MSSLVLFENDLHKNILIDFEEPGLAIQANQHMIVHKKAGMLLDPGGHKVFAKLLGETSTWLPSGGELTTLLLSHQDPDIVAATNGWLMTTDAEAYLSKLWIRFVAHFGVDKFVEDRLNPIPDEGMWLNLDDAKMAILPAHFLHSSGNFQVYDPISKILYSGDLGASMGHNYVEVTDFDEHLQYMQYFHERYIPTNAALRAWAKMARQLDIEMIAPQHGAFFRGKEMVNRFIDWCDNLTCGIELIADLYKIPPQ